MTIHFEKASQCHQATIFGWLSEPHMMEFWDNSQDHKDDILNFIHGRPQHYFYGTTQYWVGLLNGEAFSFLLSDILKPEQDLLPLQRKHLSTSGNTICLDFGIGNIKHLGKGLAHQTLENFMSFYKSHIDPLADTFFIDPDENNPKAIHVYEKAGFQMVGDYEPTKGAFIGQKSFLMIKRL